MEATEQLQALLAQVDSSPDFAEQLKRAEAWAKAAASLDRQTQDLVFVFEECVFPNNRYTRKRGDYHGSSLYLPGLVKLSAQTSTTRSTSAPRQQGAARSIMSA